MTVDTANSITYDNITNKKRECTDSFCFLFFLMNLLLWIILLLYACSTGQLTLLNQLSDSEGNLCGDEKTQVLLLIPDSIYPNDHTKGALPRPQSMCGKRDQSRL